MKRKSADRWGLEVKYVTSKAFFMFTMIAKKLKKVSAIKGAE